jgi:non-specific serine/threonine protein kinase
MIGSTLSHYRVLEKLGEGGMGEVYRAEDTRLKRQVALKVLPGEMARDPERLRRFQREAEAIASLNHPGIVTIFSVEEADGVHFLTMELVSGKRLDEMVPAGGMAMEDFVGVAVPLVEALVAAHDRGIIHRDLKPANVMVADDGQVKVLDFGLAKLRQTDRFSDETQLPTEALTDVFSVGIVLHEMITGERPFTGKSSASLITAILRDRPGSVSKLRADVPAALERVILRCLQKDPQERFQSAKELRDEIVELPTAPEEDAASRVRSIAVLPFADMSPQKDQDYFCEGIAEDIINALSKIGDLRVASRMSAFQFESRTAQPGEVGERLDVETVLSGSVRKAGERVRISAELVNARDGHQLWSERYDRELEDVFEVQDEISSNIVKALEVTLSPKEKKAIQRQAPVNIQAYEYYLRGRSLFHRGTIPARAGALEMFNRAIEIDPDFAAAYAGIADLSSYTRMYYGGDESDVQRAEEASLKALELAPDLADAHASRGVALSLQNRHEEAKEAFETAIRLDPQLFEAHYYYARSCWVQGKLEAAAEHFKEAMRVRPEDFQAPSLLGSIYHGLDQRDEALEYQKRAFINIEKHLELHPDDARALYLGSGALIGVGEIERGLEWAERAVAIDPTDTGILYNVACTYSEAGQVDEAIDYLEKAVAGGFNQKEWIVNDGDLAPVRDHPRFKALIDGMD